MTWTPSPASWMKARAVMSSLSSASEHTSPLWASGPAVLIAGPTLCPTQAPSVLWRDARRGIAGRMPAALNSGRSTGGADAGAVRLNAQDTHGEIGAVARLAKRYAGLERLVR